MDDIPIAQPVVVPPQINQPPEENNSPFHAVFEQLKKWFGGVLDYGSWFLLFFFAPFTIAIIISQNSIPGEFFYPVKLGLEKIVLNGASLHPTTRAMFHANISGRRFDEAERLLLTRSDTTGLETFITQIETTQLAVNSVSDPVEKQRLEGELLVKINEYQAKLVEVKVKAQEQGIFVAVNPQTTGQSSSAVTTPIPTLSLAPSLTSTPMPTLIPSPTPTIFVVKPTTVIATNTKLTPIPTAPPMPSATPTIITPTIPPPTHTPIPVAPPSVQAPGNQVDTDIDHTQEKLERIKKEIEEKRKEEQRERLEKLEKKEKEQEDRKEKEKKSSDAEKKEKDAD